MKKVTSLVEHTTPAQNQELHVQERHTRGDTKLIILMGVKSSKYT